MGEQNPSGTPEGKSHRQNKGKHLPLLSISVLLPREEVDGCSSEGLKSSPAPRPGASAEVEGKKGLPLGKEPVTSTLGQGQGWAVPQRLLDNSPKHRHLGNILSSRKPVGRHNGFQLLVQGLLDARVPGQVVQGPGQRVGGLGEQSAEGSKRDGASTQAALCLMAPDSPCSAAQESGGREAASMKETEAES